ncbi:hypothetical protein [uncultured Bartonella sp.]|nr:hypothetical protein [uncultured Bartonella sp.]
MVVMAFGESYLEASLRNISHKYQPIQFPISKTADREIFDGKFD